MKKMKTKRLLAVLLTLAMVLGMTVTAFATNTQTNEPATQTGEPTTQAEEDGQSPADPTVPTTPIAPATPSGDEVPTRPVIIPEGTDKGNTVRPQGQVTEGVASKGDEAVVTIQGISGSPTVTLYQIAEGKYDESGVGLIKYVPVSGASLLPEQPTSNDINKAHQEIIEGKGKLVQRAENVSGTNFVSELLPVGAYIAIISGAADGSIYNPVLLTVSYNENGILEAGAVNLVNGYLYGSTAVAKKTEPKVDKEITGGTKEDNSTTDLRDTASVGDVITYEVTPTIPSYPENATNKTLFFKDTMSEGLTFIFDSLTVGLKKADGTTIAGITRIDTTTGAAFKIDGKDVPFATATRNVSGTAVVGFYLNFDYDALMYGEGEDQHVFTPIISYQAVLNDKAVVGDLGNPNDMKMIYTNTPNEGSTFKPTNDKPEPGPDLPGYSEEEDKETVYTYELAFLKTGEGNDKDKLAGAVFGIYSDKACTKLIDVVKTNENGYAVSSQVGAGTYYIKELVAPTGYQLNEKVYAIIASQTSATTTITKETRKWKYTTDATKVSGEAIQVGWIDTKGSATTDDDVFYSMGAHGGVVSDDVDNMGMESLPENILPAYILYDETEVMTTTVTTNTPGGGAASTLIDLSVNEGEEGYNPSSILNTKLSGLPSTGGIGTTIFTIAGCLIMILAAALFFASRRKTSKK